MLHIYYGNGKGKTSCALGIIMRACGYDKKIILFQFLKPRHILSGERISLKKFPSVKVFQFNHDLPIFTARPSKKQRALLRKHLAASMRCLNKLIKKRSFDILILDEVLNLIRLNCLSERKLCSLLKPLQATKEVILTGRAKPKKLLAIADYVTELKEIKHPFQKHVLARKAIEF